MGSTGDVTKRSTQLVRIERRLRRGWWVSAWDLIQASGSLRIGARLWDLRRLGLRIETKRFPDGVWRYRMRRAHDRQLEA